MNTGRGAIFLKSLGLIESPKLGKINTFQNILYSTDTNRHKALDSNISYSTSISAPIIRKCGAPKSITRYKPFSLPSGNPVT